MSRVVEQGRARFGKNCRWNRPVELLNLMWDRENELRQTEITEVTLTILPIFTMRATFPPI